MEKKIVVYTALFGNYSGIIEQPKIKNVDFICYTDQDISSKSWIVKKVSPPVPGDNTRSNRYYKLLPHKHLPEYEISIYIDANYLILKDFTSMVIDKLENNLMLCFDHNQTVLDSRNCLYKEHDELVKIAHQLNIYRDSLDDMQKQIDFFKSEHYPENNGLIFAAVLVRKHLNQEVISLMELWWNFVKNGSKRDQLSFNYTVWKLNFNKLEYLNGDLRSGNPWFYWIDHKLDFNKDVTRIKRQKLLEKIFPILFLSFIQDCFSYGKYIHMIPYILIKIPFWFKKNKTRQIKLKEYLSLARKIIKNKLNKRMSKNLISEIL